MEFKASLLRVIEAKKSASDNGPEKPDETLPTLKMQRSSQTRIEISAIFQNHFRRSNSKMIQHLALNVYFVLVGIKPAYLMDQNPFGSNVSIETKLTALDRILNDIGTTLLHAISIREHDIVIINRESVLLNLKEKNNKVFVDISSDLGESKVLTNQTALDSINQMVSSTIVQFESQARTPSFQLATEVTWNISTLFGILIDYPVVYYYSDFSDCTNCLGQVDLYNHKLFAHLEDLTDSKLVYSFTYPVSLHECCASKVDSWTRKLKQRLPDDSLTIETATVNLDVVVL